MYPLALLLAFSLPFDAIQPLLTTPWVTLTDEKLVLALFGAAWLLGGARAWPTPDERRALLPTFAFLVVSLISALVAPDYIDDALKSVWRLVAAVLVMLLGLRLATDESRLRAVLWAVVLGAGASGLLGLAEASGARAFQPLLDLFKVAPTSVGGEVRVSGSFQYATIASMYFEMVAPLALVLAAQARSRGPRWLMAGVAGLCTANVLLSLTRAGILTLLVEFGVLLVCAWRRPAWRGVAAPTLACAAALLVGVGWLVARNPVFDMRLSSESDADWYGAVYVAPATLAVPAATPLDIDLEVRNAGRIAWSPGGAHPFSLGYRWLTADGNAVLEVPTAEVSLPRVVAPGETVPLRAHVPVPNLPSGTYRIDWSMQQRDVVQFYERGWPTAQTLVHVAPGPAPATMPEVVPRDDGEAPWVVGRLDLWRAAVELIRSRPILGVGPDNFRHFYGAVLGLEDWDQRVQANNVYLEVLVDAGVVGLAAFLWVIAWPLVRAWRVLRGAGGYLPLGLSLAALAFLAHGLLDSFLAFTPTALLWWLMLGGLAQKPHVSGR